MTAVAPSEPPKPTPSHAATPQEDRGSLGAGIGLAWAIAVVGNTFCAALMASLLGRHGDWVVSLWLLPYLAIIGLAIFLYRKGKPRTGQGLMLGLLSMIAVAVLLVAACFGLLSGFKE
jgi:hypothetical protein